MAKKGDKIIGKIESILENGYGVISLGSDFSAGAFVVNAYPISIHMSDVWVVLFTVLFVGFTSVFYPIRYLSKRLLVS